MEFKILFENGKWKGNVVEINGFVSTQRKCFLNPSWIVSARPNWHLASQIRIRSGIRTARNLRERTCHRNVFPNLHPSVRVMVVEEHLVLGSFNHLRAEIYNSERCKFTTIMHACEQTNQKISAGLPRQRESSLRVLFCCGKHVAPAHSAAHHGLDLLMVILWEFQFPSVAWMVPNQSWIPVQTFHLRAIARARHCSDKPGCWNFGTWAKNYIGFGSKSKIYQGKEFNIVIREYNAHGNPCMDRNNLK